MADDTHKKVTVRISPISVIQTILIILAVLALYGVRQLVLVVLVAVAIATAIEPTTRWFTSRNMPRAFAVVIIYLGLMLAFVGAFYFILIPLFVEAREFIRLLPGYLDELETWFPLLGDGLNDSFSPQDLVAHLNELVSNLTGGFFNVIAAVFGGVLSFVLIIVLSFYLAVQDSGVIRFIKMVTPPLSRKYVIGLWRRAEKKIGFWVQGQLILALIVGVMVYAGLLALGIPNALLLASLSAVFELIPIFGPILAAIPAILIAFVEGGWVLALLVTVLYIIIQQIESQIIYPLLVNKVVGVPPLVAIISLVAGYQLAGFLGIILSVPVAAVVLELLKDYHQKDIEDDGVTDPPKTYIKD